MKKIIIILSLSFVIIYCKDTKNNTSSSSEKIIERRYSSAKSGLRLRDQPTLKGSKVVGGIPYREKVDILKKTGKTETIGGINGEWYQVKWKSRSGYAFGAFLSSTLPKKLPPKPKKSLLKSGFIVDMVLGDVACYIDFKGVKTSPYAEPEFCVESSKYIKKQVTLGWTKATVSSPECGYNPACKKTQLVNVINKIVVKK